MISEGYQRGAFAIRDLMKSTSEMCVTLGVAKLNSRVQKLNSKSSTESEISAVIVPGPGSRSYRVPTLPDPTGYYYCTLQLGCRIVEFLFGTITLLIQVNSLVQQVQKRHKHKHLLSLYVTNV